MLGVPGALATRRRGVGEVLPFVYGEAPAAVFTGEQEGGPRGQLGGDPRLVEPSRSYMPRSIADFDADHAEAAFAERARLGALDFDRDRGRLSRGEIAQLAD